MVRRGYAKYGGEVVVGWLVWGDIYSVHIVEDEVRFGQTNVSKLICYDFVGVVLLIFCCWLDEGDQCKYIQKEIQRKQKYKCRFIAGITITRSKNRQIKE